MVRAAQNAVNLDERIVNAVAARIELDLRIGYAFTRFNTLTLQAMGGDLNAKIISYGVLQVLRLLYEISSLTLRRILPVPDARFCRRQVFQSQEFRSGKFLEHQSNAHS